MKQLRMSCVVFFGWLFVLYNIERLHKPINLASFVYVLAAVVGLLILASPRLYRVSLAWLLVLPLPAFFLLKVLLKYPLVGPALPYTVTEICAIWLTVVLARQFGCGLHEFHSAVISAMSARLTETSRAFADGQGEIHREIRRARLYHRPLSMLAISATPQSLSGSLHHFVEEVQRESLDRFVAGRIAEFLSSEMKACDIITHREGHFVALLPETGREEAAAVMAQLEGEARTKLGLDLKMGLSVFPDEEFTFVGLLEKAEESLRQQLAPDPKLNGQPAGAPLPLNGEVVPAPAQQPS
jgi:hypothetical protein